MISNYLGWVLFLFLSFFLNKVIAQERDGFQLLEYIDFDKPADNWQNASDVWWGMGDLADEEKIVNGEGVLVNVPTEENRGHLLTRESYGDIELELDFMMAPESNSGIYLMGRYEVQLLDSWKKEFPGHYDCGGIYQRWDENREEGQKGFEGVPPLVNASRAPGLWQHLRIFFRAPQFDENGNKIKNARFEKVYLNGLLVQSQVEVGGPTRSSFYSDEKELGPLMVQGDHGKVALRNIKISSLGEIEYDENESVEDPIYVRPNGSPYVLRSYLDFNGEKLPYAISVGYPEGINYSYDTRQGALLQVWRGDFIETTGMWHRRGNSQVASPMGSIVTFSDLPNLTDRDRIKEEWIGLYELEDIHMEGYTLDERRNPVFQYSLEGNSVNDHIAPMDGRSGLLRRVEISSQDKNWLFRVANGNLIQKVATNLYRINHSYYIELDQKYAPEILSLGKNQELRVPLSDQPDLFEYKIIW
ncbi:3-keto-disaccharide hydrolase [Membranihabitans maritimus]|uniref:3-keto-disaccharide hydrolase n=1 Tax=Membranihabitans maritimus TaxID=2904244 RepID=UPI001F16DD28|nr:DUF1080 domain-containing protein [Membranihabitans maritimus]